MLHDFPKLTWNNEATGPFFPSFLHGGFGYQQFLILHGSMYLQEIPGQGCFSMLRKFTLVETVKPSQKFFKFNDYNSYHVHEIRMGGEAISSVLSLSLSVSLQT